MSFIHKFVVVLVFIPALASAHGPVTTLKATSGPYTIEFEYNTQGSLFAGDYTIFDTYLLKSTEGVDYDSAFIRIEKHEGTVVMAGSLNESADTKGYATISGIISDAGTYDADVSFYTKDNKIAEGQFSFEVKPPQISAHENWIMANKLPIGTFGGGLILGAGIILWLKQIKKI